MTEEGGRLDRRALPGHRVDVIIDRAHGALFSPGSQAVIRWPSINQSKTSSGGEIEHDQDDNRY